HPNAVMHRNFYYNNEQMQKTCRDINKHGLHSFLVFYLAAQSPVYIIDKPMSVGRKVIKPTGTNYSSFAAKHPDQVAINDLLKYINYRRFFHQEYNFDTLIRDKFALSIFRIISQNGRWHTKAKRMLEAYLQLNLREKIILPFLTVQYINNRK